MGLALLVECVDLAGGNAQVLAHALGNAVDGHIEYGRRKNKQHGLVQFVVSDSAVDKKAQRVDAENAQ